MTALVDSSTPLWTDTAVTPVVKICVCQCTAGNPFLEASERESGGQMATSYCFYDRADEISHGNMKMVKQRKL